MCLPTFWFINMLQSALDPMTWLTPRPLRSPFRLALTVVPTRRHGVHLSRPHGWRVFGTCCLLDKYQFHPSQREENVCSSKSHSFWSKAPLWLCLVLPFLRTCHILHLGYYFFGGTNCFIQPLFSCSPVQNSIQWMFAKWMCLVNKQMTQQVKMKHSQLFSHFSTSTADVMFIISLI